MDFETLQAALIGLRRRLAEVDREMAEVGKQAGAPQLMGNKRRLSAAGRLRISEAQRLRWAKVKGKLS